MKTTVKRNLCVLNTFLSAIIFLIAHATVWLSRSESEGTWVYFDQMTIELCLVAIALLFAFWSIFWNPNESKRWYIVAAVLHLVPAIVLVVALSLTDLKHGQLIRVWRTIPAIILYFVVAIIYLVLAFTKNKEAKKDDEPIPYSE